MCEQSTAAAPYAPREVNHALPARPSRATTPTAKRKSRRVTSGTLLEVSIGLQPVCRPSGRSRPTDAGEDSRNVENERRLEASRDVSGEDGDRALKGAVRR